MAILFAAMLAGPAWSSAAHAQDAGPDKPPVTEADYLKANVKVIQKRPVGKASRLEINPFLWYLGNDDFVRGYFPGANVDYHFNEGVALEGTLAYGIHSNKVLLGNLQTDGVQPAVLDRAVFIGSIGFNWAPIYGKISYLDKSIVTYDLFLTSGYGNTNTNLTITTTTPSTTPGGPSVENSTKTNTNFAGYYIGVGQRYYLSNHSAFRIELRNYAYTQRVNASYNDRNNLLFGVGWSFFL